MQTLMPPQAHSFDLLVETGWAYFRKIKQDPSIYLLIVLPFLQNQLEKRSLQVHFWRSLNNALYFALATWSFHTMLLNYEKPQDQVYKIAIASFAVFKLYQNKKNELDPRQLSDNNIELQNIIGVNAEEIKKHKEEINRLNTEIQTLKDQLKVKDDELGQLKTNYEQMRKQLSESQKDNQKLQNEIKKLKEEIKQNSADQDALEKSKELCNKRSRKLAELRVKVKSLEEKNAALEKRHESQLKEMESLRANDIKFRELLLKLKRCLITCNIDIDLHLK